MCALSRQKYGGACRRRPWRFCDISCRHQPVPDVISRFATEMKQSGNSFYLRFNRIVAQSYVSIRPMSMVNIRWNGCSRNEYAAPIRQRQAVTQHLWRSSKSIIVQAVIRTPEHIMRQIHGEGIVMPSVHRQNIWDYGWRKMTAALVHPGYDVWAVCY